MVLPFYNLAVFFIRFAGIINSINTNSAWKTSTLTQERSLFRGTIRSDTRRVSAFINKLRKFVNEPET